MLIVRGGGTEEVEVFSSFVEGSHRLKVTVKLFLGFELALFIVEGGWNAAQLVLLVSSSTKGLVVL